MANQPIEFKSILVADDFTPHGSAALQAAAEIAKTFGAELHVAHVVTNVYDAIATMPSEARWDFIAGDVEKFQSGLMHDAQERLREVVKPLENQGIPCRTLTLLGAAWLHLIHAVQKSGYDLVVTGTRGGSALRRILVGSTAQRLVRHCPAPVWVTRDQPWTPLKSVLAAIDFSEASEEVLRTAASVAVRAQARLEVLHVVEASHEIEAAGGSGDKPTLATERIDRAIREQVHEFINRTIGSMLPGGINIEWGEAWEAISETAKRHESGLIVVGTVGRSGVPGILLGNTAEKVLYSSTCSVLAVKPPSFVCTIPPAIHVS
jgi:universal stress protein E